MIFYFSGTGNSRWVATEMANRLKDNLYFIPDANKESIVNYTPQKGEKIGFVFPIHAWNVPKLVRLFIKKLELKGYNKQYIYFICTCGDDTGYAGSKFKKMIAKKNWKCQAGFSIQMPNDYVLFKGFDVDPTELVEQKLKKAEISIDDIGSFIEKEGNIFKVHKGTFPAFKTFIINPFFERNLIDSKKFFVTETCTYCKKCAKVCPMDNIVWKGKPIWGNACISCLGCYNVCPKKAIQYGKVTLSKGQYYFPNKK